MGAALTDGWRVSTRRRAARLEAEEGRHEPRRKRVARTEGGRCRPRRRRERGDAEEGRGAAWGGEEPAGARVWERGVRVESESVT